MHWCHYCGQACYCDSDDTDFGECYPLNAGCPHEDCFFAERDDEDEEE